MKVQKATYSIHLDNRRQKKDGSFPIKLKITYNRDRQYYGIGRDIFLKDWEQIKANKAKGFLKDLKTELGDIESRAKEVIDYLKENKEEFSFIRFEQIFFNIKNYTNNIYEAFSIQINELQNNGQISNSDSYRCAQKSLFDFLQNTKYRFNEIEPKTLEKYERWMKEKGKSNSTISIYLRTLRALYNRAMREGVIKIEQYPFGKNKYVIPSSDIADKGIPKSAIKRLYQYSPEEKTNEDMAKDLWFFMYLCNGMNVKDVCRLRNSNVQNDIIVYRRAKTENKSKTTKQITILLNNEIESIILKWGNFKRENKDDYIFPFFSKGISPVDERRISQNLTGLINDWMKRIAKKLEIDLPITTYSARHSHSNILKEENAPIKLIADNLGHSTTQVTEKHYLTEYDKQKRKEFADKLLNF